MPLRFTLSERPTLPPLRTLALPTMERQEVISNDNDLHQYPQPIYHRQCSISSTSSSRSPSPTSSTSSLGSALPKYPPSTYKYRLIPSTLEDANAVIVVPPPNAPVIPSLSAEPIPTFHYSNNRALLLVGPSVEHCRSPNRQIAKGARIHPYRIVPQKHSHGNTVHFRRTSLYQPAA